MILAALENSIVWKDFDGNCRKKISDFSFQPQLRLKARINSKFARAGRRYKEPQ